VVEYGMSDLGPINFGPTMDVSEWGKSYYEQNTLSQEMLAKIDTQVNKILQTAYTKASNTVKEKKDILDKVAKELLIKESLDQDEFEKIAGKKEAIASLSIPQ